MADSQGKDHFYSLCEFVLKMLCWLKVSGEMLEVPMTISRIYITLCGISGFRFYINII